MDVGPDQDPHSGRSSGRSTAPVHSVPQASIVSIEHPCIVSNFDNGFKSLGGEPQLRHVLDHKVGDSLIKVNGKTNTLPEPVAGVSLRPNDPMAKKIASKGVDTRNVLVKVTVPKWTGRKRKRGSQEPFVPASPAEQSRKSVKAPDILHRLRDSEGGHLLEPVGMIEETHKFRSQLDFQMHSGDLPIMNELRNHVMKPRYEDLSEFKIDLRPGARDASAFPLPPSLMQTDQPYRYEYQQAPNVVFKTDEHGNAVAENTNLGHAKRQTSAIAPDAPEVPQEPPIDLDSSNLTDTVKRAIPKLRELLDKRPLITKRVAKSVIPNLNTQTFYEAGQFVGYMFSAGPWRDTLIRYGVDPRSDPKYRFYQTIMIYFRGKAAKVPSKPSRQAAAVQAITAAASSATPAPADYIFDGVHYTPTEGSLWQFCDLTDSTLYNILHTPHIRSTVDIMQWGWFHNGTLSKARVIMRDKVQNLMAGETPPEDDYKGLDDIPDEMTEENFGDAHWDKTKHSRAVFELRKAVRVNAKGYGGMKPGEKGKGRAKSVDNGTEDLEGENDGMEDATFEE